MPTEFDIAKSRPGVLTFTSPDGSNRVMDVANGTVEEFTQGGTKRSITVGSFDQPDIGRINNLAQQRQQFEYSPDQKRRIDTLRMTADKFQSDSGFNDVEKATALAKIDKELSLIQPRSPVTPPPTPEQDFAQNSFTDENGYRWVKNAKGWEQKTDPSDKVKKGIDYKDYLDARTTLRVTIEEKLKDQGITDPAEIDKATDDALAASIRGYQALIGQDKSDAQRIASAQSSQSQSYSKVSGPAGTFINGQPADGTGNPAAYPQKVAIVRALIDSGKLAKRDINVFYDEIKRAKGLPEQDQIVNKFLAAHKEVASAVVKDAGQVKNKLTPEIAASFYVAAGRDKTKAMAMAKAAGYEE